MSEINAGKLAEALNDKVDRDLNNIPQTVAVGDNQLTQYIFNRIKKFYTNPDKTVLFAGPAGTGDITLSESYQNYDAILVVGSNDNSNAFHTNLITRFQLDELRNQSQGKRWFLYCTDDNYWICKASSTDTVFVTDTENCMIHKIYGLRF